LLNTVTPIVSLSYRETPSKQASLSNKASQSVYTQNSKQEMPSHSFQTTVTPTQDNSKVEMSAENSIPPVISQSPATPPSVAYIISWSGEYKPTETLSPTPYVNKTIVYNTSQEYIAATNNSDWHINYLLYGFAASLVILIPSYITYAYICTRKKIARPQINIPVSRENPLLSSSQLQQRRRSISLESINKKNKTSPMLRSSTSPVLTSMYNSPDSPV